jgi:colanic acid/amylovoran biosynthesis glycosyltransferase
LDGFLTRSRRIDADQLRDLLTLEPREATQALDLAVLVADRRITHLHAHFGSVPTTVARAAARLSGIGYSFTAHAKDIYHQEVDPAAMSRKLSDARAVITVSDFNHDHLRRRYGPAASRVRRIYNGIDLRQYGYRTPQVRPEGEPPLIAAVGRLVEKKGFADLIRAAGRLRDRGLDFRLQIAGTGPLADQLDKQIADLGLRDRAELLGPLPQDEVRRLVTAATVFAAPCVVGADGNRDGLPTVLLEAMALGTPCISTPVTGIGEAIEDGRTGVLVDQHDSDALASAIGRLLGDLGLRRRLSRAARDRIEVEFDAARQGSRVADVFAGLHQQGVA